MRKRYVALLVAIAALAVPSGAAGRSLYVTSYEADSVNVLDSTSLSPLATPIPTGGESGPYSMAITPDGKTVWAVNYKSGELTSISTATNAVSGNPIEIGLKSFGFAIAPDGTQAYMAEPEEDMIRPVDLEARVPLARIPAGDDPDSITITPDGKHVYVSSGLTESVLVLDTATNQLVGAPIPVGGEPYGAAITPDGRFLYVANEFGYVSVIETATNQVVAKITVPGEPALEQMAILPNGSRAYASDFKNGDVYVIDTATRQLIGSPIHAGEQIEYLAGSPDGKRLYAVQFNSPGAVVAIDTATNQVVGTPGLIGDGGSQLAAVPDRSPSAAASYPGKARPGVPITFDGTGSTDVDGTVASWAWTFGDGGSATLTTPTVAHAYAKPGSYPVGLKVTDNEGCGEAQVFTGMTAYCSGPNPEHLPVPAIARPASVVVVAYPGVKLKCPKSAKGGCKYKLKAVQRKKKGKLKPLSAPAKAKAKAGKAVVISLKPKASFAKKLAAAKKILVQVTTTVAGEARVKVSQLKVVQ